MPTSADKYSDESFANTTKTVDTLDRIIAYEQGELEDEHEVIALFQELVNTGLAWQLQGSYGRTAAQLISLGLVSNLSKEAN